jgi:hypothetical protein
MTVKTHPSGFSVRSPPHKRFADIREQQSQRLPETPSNKATTLKGNAPETFLQKAEARP